MRIDRALDALLVIDLQHDYLPGGALAVRGGAEIVAPIGRIARAFGTVVATQDWHPPAHVSFASAHPPRLPFDAVDLPQGRLTLWPDHCVRGEPGAAIHPDLPDASVTLILRKGTRRDADGFSAFRDGPGPDGRRATTGLGAWLEARGIERLFLAGLPRDFCVRYSALDAVAAGFEALLVEDLTRAVFPERAPEVNAAFERAGVRITRSTDLTSS